MKEADEKARKTKEDARKVIEHAKLVDPTTDPFKELTECYEYTTRWASSVDDGWLEYNIGEETSSVVDMSTQIPCSYSKWNDDVEKYESIVLGGYSSHVIKRSANH